MAVAPIEIQEYHEDHSLRLGVGDPDAHFYAIFRTRLTSLRTKRCCGSSLLAHHGVLRDPFLYLSIFFKQHRQENDDRLRYVRDRGEWEAWLEIFLEGVATVSNEATKTARKIVQLREDKRRQINDELGRRSGNSQTLLEYLFRHPYVNVKTVQGATDLSQPAANALVNAMEEIGILREITGKKTYRIFAFAEFMDLFEERTNRS